VYGVTEYLMIVHEDAKARLPSAGSKRTEDLSNRTAQEVLDDHLGPSEHGSSENPVKAKFAEFPTCEVCRSSILGTWVNRPPRERHITAPRHTSGWR
jgi:hypothetical protein